MKLGKCKEIIGISLTNFFQPAEIDKYFSNYNYSRLCGRYLIKKSLLDFFKSSNYLDIGVLNDEKGKPILSFQGELLEEMKKKGVKKVLCSISHSRNWVASMVIIDLP